MMACATPLVTQQRSSPVPFGRPAPTASRTSAALAPTAGATPAESVSGETTQASATVVDVGGTEIAPVATVVSTGEALPEATSAVTQTVVAETPVVIIPVSAATPTNNERWRAQEINRQPFPAAKTYITTGSNLLWYDPVYQQTVLLGSFRGSFDALATFQLRGSDQTALEVLYEVNKRYGLTALSPAVVERIRAAGYESGFIDAYVILDNNVQPQ